MSVILSHHCISELFIRINIYDNKVHESRTEPNRMWNALVDSTCISLVPLRWFLKVGFVIELSSCVLAVKTRAKESEQAGGGWGRWTVAGIVISFAWFVFPYAWTYHKLFIFNLWSYCLPYRIQRRSGTVKEWEQWTCANIPAEWRPHIIFSAAAAAFVVITVVFHLSSMAMLVYC